MSESTRPDHVITGNHPVRRAGLFDTKGPCWRVDIPCGFESLVIHVHGDGLCQEDAVEAAFEWMKETTPEWTNKWEEYAAASHATLRDPRRYRWLVAALQDNFGLADWVLLHVTHDLRELRALMRLRIEEMQLTFGGRFDMTERGSLAHHTLDRLPPEPFGNWTQEDRVAAVEMRGEEESWFWLPEDVDATEFLGRCRPARTELGGLQVWSHSTRFTCYADGDGNRRIESERLEEAFKI